MTISDLYLICFVVGFLLSVLSFLFGNLHLHVPHIHFHIGHAPHIPHAPHVPHGTAGASGVSTTQLPVINFGTITAFLAWFGGIGYLLTKYSGWLATISLLVAIFGGMVGAAIIFFMVSKLLMQHDKPLNEADYEMVGVLGQICSSIREGGTGEIIYTQEGTRWTAGARSEDGKAIARGTEVIVTRYENGLAYVRPWEDMEKELDDKQSGVSI
ncbi:MAG TPA: NfeD family protein [Terriglobales bacterium]|nr:NfeD family protein [Terriglobales bacterium]